MATLFNRLRKARKEIEHVEATMEINTHQNNKEMSSNDLNAMRDRIEALNMRVDAIEVNGDDN